LRILHGEGRRLSCRCECNDCGKPVGFLIVVPFKIWAEINPNHELLCLDCIDNRCAAKEIFCEVELYFQGKAVRAGTMGTLAKHVDVTDYRKALEAIAS
jgi:hypothetical protein